ncbi:uncharacterized protein [Physcomitrium patens]|uniref:Remorin C-terminal domain-containing protein n=1 Tax=Physcomitrium patens TaxID=3218 RepID=A0A7I4FRU6_PHYPA|nr:uncharacterized protein LOC112283610 isoform X2 [Physcomitrium patens]|eukprot:XP_024378303.1 uncharacterized protein LOC112283610 isoform X2 [Physcomitrella patens]
MAFPAPPEDVLTTPRFAFRNSMIPRPVTNKEDDGLSPKSVIVDRRFVSPASSSSSSIDRRTLSETNLHKGQPRHDRGYSISDGEFSDSESFVDYSGTSRELGKVGNSGPLESLPETHSLALDTTNSTISSAVEMSRASTTSESRDGESNCPFSSPSSLSGLETSAPIALSALVERTSDFGRDVETTSLFAQKTESNRLPSSRGSVIPAYKAAGEDEDQIYQLSEWYQTSTSSDSASDQEGKESSSSSTVLYAESDNGTRRREIHISQSQILSSELSTSGSNRLERELEVTKKRLVAPGAASNFGYIPGTPMRFFPVWHGLSGTPLVNNPPALYSASPRVEKGIGSSSPASATGLTTPLRYQHRFLSGPILGSMIPKPPPSKWDDAEKWIVSPGHNEASPVQPPIRPLQAHAPAGRRHSIAGAQSLRSLHEVGSPDYLTAAGEKPMSPNLENVSASAGKIEGKIEGNTLKKRSKALSFGDLSRRFDLSRASGKPPAAQPQDRLFTEDNDAQGAGASVPSSTDALTISTVGDEARELTAAPSAREAGQQAQPPVGVSEMKLSGSCKDSGVMKHGRSVSMKEISAVDPLAAEPVSFQSAAARCRDMGTQMTPVESLKNSTCTTPGLAISPTRHNTPARSGTRRAASLGDIPGGMEALELQSCHLAKLGLRKVAVDGQPTLDRNIVWTTREEEEMESSASLREAHSEDQEKSRIAAKVSAWVEAEQAKATARYKNKEAKIKEWEELQKAQSETDMKKIEAKVEKILAEANEKMKGKLAFAAKKAAEMRAAAQALQDEQATKTAERAELIRETGLLSPPTRYSFRCCFLAK